MSTDHNFSTERGAETDSNRGPCAFQPNALPYHQKSAHTSGGDYSGPCQSQPCLKTVSTPRNDPGWKDTRKICFYYLDLHVIVQGRSLFIKLDLHGIIQGRSACVTWTCTSLYEDPLLLLGHERHYTRETCFLLLGHARHYTRETCFY